MPEIIANRVGQTTTTTSTGTVDLDGTITGKQTFVAGIGDGNTCKYVISDPATGDWEMGTGTVTDAAPDTLSRDTVIDNSLGDTTKINFGGGTKQVFHDIGAATLSALVTDVVANTAKVTNATHTGEVTGATALTIASTVVDADNLTAGMKLSSIQFVIDGGGSAITTGVKGFIEIPFACDIIAVRLLADQSGSIVVDIWNDTYANYPPTVADTITASAIPTISTATKSEDVTLTGWTTAISEGDILGFNVDSITTLQRVTLSLTVNRT